MKYAAFVLRGAHSSIFHLQISLQKHLPLFYFFQKLGLHVDIFLISYESSEVSSLLTHFQPVKTVFLPQQEFFTLNSWKRQAWFHIKSKELIEEVEKEKNIQYDLIVNTRFDIAFVKNLEDFGTFDFTKINCCLRHECGNCDDNLFIFPRNLLNIFVDAFQKIYDENRITHEFSKIVDEKLMNYLFEEKDFRTTHHDEHGNAVEVYNYFYLSRKHV